MFTRISICLVAGISALSAGCGLEGEPGLPAEGVVLQDAYSPTGALIVTRDPQGQLSVVIRGRIGVDQDSVGQAAIEQKSLAAMYLALHPGASAVPRYVRALSDELASQRTATVRQIAPAPRPGESVELDDREGFLAAACQLIGGGFEGFSPVSCPYQDDAHSICTDRGVSSRDGSIGWNQSPHSATHWLTGHQTTFGIPPFTWQWAQWGGSYTRQWACLSIDPVDGVGSLGITHHRYFTDNPVIEL